MSTEHITVGIIEHLADDCPAVFRDKADIVVPALRKAKDAGLLPETGVFSPKDHRGGFVVMARPEEIEIPEIPHHLPVELTLIENGGDLLPWAKKIDWLANDADRETFLAVVEQHAKTEFPNKQQITVPFFELAGFVEAKHE